MQIYFDTATFDEVERDKKIKTEAQLSLIGGTMGLLTGFSIISSVKIVFFLLKLIRFIKIPKRDAVSSAKGDFTIIKKGLSAEIQVWTNTKYPISAMN